LENSGGNDEFVLSKGDWFMRVVFVNPPRFDEVIPVTREDRCEVTDRYSIVPPYSLACMASILREKGHEVSIIDANALNITYIELDRQLKSNIFDVLVFRFTPTTFDWDMKVAEIVKTEYSRVATIGICLTLHLLGKEVLNRSKHLDYYLPLDWEDVLPNLLNFIERGGTGGINGVYHHNNSGIEYEPIIETTTDFNALPLPAYDLLPDFKLYRPNVPTSGNYMVLYSSKGCPYSCTYCTVARTPFKIKSPERLLEELKILYDHYNVRLVSFFDETFTLKKPRILSLCNSIEETMPELRWYCNTRANLVDEEIFNAMKSGGCRGLSLGIESGSQKILDNVKKGITTAEAVRAIKMAKAAGLLVYASFIFGLPGEDQGTAKETLKFVKNTLPHGAQFNIAVPYPGTEFYNYAKDKDLVSREVAWEDLMQHKATVHTESLSQSELEEIRKNAYRMLYLNPEWFGQNLKWVLHNTGYLSMGVKYYVKALTNLLLHKMEHAH